MNCQEVMELMQRQLDDDLSDDELSDLNNHTRQCPDCAATFERLKRLSSELASLPKVTPRYSLVDAILPELERIEIETKQPEREAGAIIGPASLPAKRAGDSRRLKPDRKWPSWSAVGSVVAAGIVAGLFLLNAPNFGGGSANDKAELSADLNAESAANASIADTYKIDDQTVDAGGDLPADEVKLFNTEAPGSQAEAAGASEGGSPEIDETVKKVQRNGSAQITATSGNGDEPASLEAGPVEPSHVGGDKSESQSFKGTADGGATEEAEPAGDVEEQAEVNKKVEPDMGIAIATDFPSPDGSYIAHVYEYQIVILAAESGETLMTTERKNGHHGGLVWSEDGTELSYEVQLDQGAIEIYTISTADWTEQKASH
jgi:hypothetical protein